MLAEGGSVLHASARAGVSTSAIDKWKQAKEFQERIAEVTAVFRARFMEEGLARKEARLALLTDLIDRQTIVMTERAKDAVYRKAPGGKSGLIVVRTKVVKSE